MTITINLSDPLAAKLAGRARAERVSVEELAVEILSDAVDSPRETSDWTSQNTRRITLIRKRFANGLTADEERELQRLQGIADQHLEQLDEKMLDDLEQMRLAVEHAVGDAPKSGNSWKCSK
jgi:plasmid stability protein